MRLMPGTLSPTATARASTPLEEIFEDDRLERASRRVLEAEAKRIIRKELEMNYQTQGYSTNYDIEVWNVNDWG